MLKAIDITWLPSAKRRGAFAGYVHAAKVCAMIPRAGSVTLTHDHTPRLCAHAAEERAVDEDSHGSGAAMAP